MTMIGKFGAAAGFACAVVLAAGAGAKPASDTDERRASHALFECVVEKNSEAASDFVMRKPVGRARGNLLSQLLENGCVNGDNGKLVTALKSKPDHIRFGLADALIAREYAASIPPGMAAVAPLKHIDVAFDEIEFVRGQVYKNGGPKALERARAEAAAQNFMARFGECVVRRNPAVAHRFLLTSPTSKEETLALAGVRPQMATCIGDGQKIGLNLYSLRGAMALGFYRLAHAAQAVPGSN